MGLMPPGSLVRHSLEVCLIAGLLRQMIPRMLELRKQMLTSIGLTYLACLLYHLCCLVSNPVTVWCHLHPFQLVSYLVRSLSHRWRIGLLD